jgi:hypothetical protein
MFFFFLLCTLLKLPGYMYLLYKFQEAN